MITIFCSGRFTIAYRFSDEWRCALCGKRITVVT